MRPGPEQPPGPPGLSSGDGRASHLTYGPQLDRPADRAGAADYKHRRSSPDPAARPGGEALPLAAATLFEMRSEALTLIDRFQIPPFSVLDCRAGYWQDRKRTWLALGIESELGRDDNLLAMSDQARDTGIYTRQKDGQEAARLREEIAQSHRAIPGGGTGKNSAWLFKTPDGYEASDDAQQKGTGTSIFDPVLCEIMYRWFCPAGGRVVDPFAGGSVRGIVAAERGLAYHGIELRAEQLAANQAQAERIGPGRGWPFAPSWVEGDAVDCRELLADHYPFDFLFTCPPYYDLEVYSDDPRDLSTFKSYELFLEAYRLIIWHASALLADNRFAAIVVGDLRDRDGFYRGFPADTIREFEKAGLRLYNEAVLITSVGSAALRAGRIFKGGRKLCHSHQYALVFCKGDPKKAHAACGVCTCDEHVSDPKCPIHGTPA